MRLLRAAHSTNSERVALALAHKGLEVESTWIEYADRSEVLRVSEQALVPVLVDDDGSVVVDSMAIVAHLERRHPDPPLYPTDPARRAEVDLLVDWFDRVWKVAPNAIDAELDAPHPDPARLAARWEELRGALERFEALLTGRAHLMSQELGAADLAVFPFVKYAALDLAPGDEERFHRILRDGQRTDSHPRLRDWIARVDLRPRA